MVSFIIPVYNGEMFIERCVRSIIDNTAADMNYEVIIINDGSQDRTRDIVNQIAGKYIFVKVIHQKNAGVSAAREAGIEKAAGEWIVFVDADDLVTADIVKIISLCQQSNSDWLIFSGKFLDTCLIDVTISQNRRSILTAILNQSEDSILMKVHLNTVWSKAYRKEIIEKYRIEFEQTLSHGEDMLFNIDYLERCSKICFVSQYVYELCVNGNSATHKYQKNCIANDKAFFEIFNNRDLCRNESSIKNVYNKMVINGIWICLGQYFTHPSNKMKLKEKRIELAAFLNQEPYKTGLKNCSLEKKMIRKIVLVLLNYHFYSLVLQGLKFMHKPENVDEIGSMAI